MQVAQFLHNQGFNRVANIAGGINAWADEVDNTVPRY
jgi:rhodanese-related sulfurtransferase